MKKVKKILIALLAMVLCVSTLVSCGGGRNLYGAFEDGDATDDTVVNGASQDLNLLEGYRIVYKSGNDAEEEFAKLFQKAVLKVTGVSIPVQNDIEWEDEESSWRQDKEILIGETNRKDEYSIPEEQEYYDKGGYTMFLANERLVIMLGSRTGMYFALRDFVKEFFKQDLDKLDKDVEKLSKKSGATLTLSKDFTMHYLNESQYLPYIGNALSKYKVVYDGGSYMLKRMAFNLQRMFKNTTVEAPTMAASSSKPAGSVFYLQLVDKAEAEDGGNEWIEPGKWTIEYSKSMFTIKASSYYGFLDAANYFKTARNQYGFYDFGKNDVTAEGDYVDNATGHYESTKYAYNQQGNTRVMYLNVLFNESQSSEDKSKSFDTPTDQRNQIQQMMIAEYMPDVLGCQEFNKSRRGGSKAAELGGKGGLSALLADIGYVEAVDPRVKNAYGTNEIIPGADASLVRPEAKPGAPLYGYGTGGADAVSGVAGVTHTYYNNTPLFYNAETTKLIAAEYYWYKYQTDFYYRENFSQYVNGYHQNSAGDAGSKAATWGVFESKESGQRYIVITTHMCTRSDYIRSLQAQEVVDLINKLVAIYDCPVFFGGDMNGTDASSNYKLFVSEEVGYIAMQDSLDENGQNYAKIFTAKTKPSHGYPNQVKGDPVISAGANDESQLRYVNITEENAGKGTNAIDHTFVANWTEDLVVNVFGVIVDDCSMSSSDHLPHFVDFNLAGESLEGGEYGPSVVPK